jgi:DNA polymerase III subunit chi
VTEWGFYHCTRTKPQAALPRLLGRTLQAGERAVVLCGDAPSVTALDAALWQCSDPDWLPHGTQADGDADLQPIWITATPEAPNGARFLFLLDNATVADAATWSRIFDLFDGDDASAVAAARTRWSAAKAAGHALTYWQQGANGWQKKTD